MFEKLSVQELFPTPLWICDLTEGHHRRLNADLKALIEGLIEPRPAIELGSTWQTDPILHQLPQFADFIAIVEGAARGAFEFLGLRYDSFEITGCLANVNPQGGLNSRHNHPNTSVRRAFLPRGTPHHGQLLFAPPPPRPGLMAPPPPRKKNFTPNKTTADAKEGRMFLFPGWLFHSVPVNRSTAERISI